MMNTTGRKIRILRFSHFQVSTIGGRETMEVTALKVENVDFDEIAAEIHAE
ncbi:hypothetical protein [Methanohalophilus levihalophilus]|uniref:hypothetical protein n=1 Tax=Methanohalophilus levihalophilus TaxID=1431282 RepID=UPI001AE97E39|nr:hypothetical protein [Methanohalophilus levihalophilus]